jgi:hypothetical protein
MFGIIENLIGGSLCRGIVIKEYMFGIIEGFREEGSL